MATQKIERTFPNRTGDELFRELKSTIDGYAEKYSLSEEVDSERNHIRVQRTGFEGNLQVEADRVTLTLDYSPLLPGPVKRRITDGVVSALDKMAGRGA